MSRSCPGRISPVITSAGVCYSMVPSHVVSFAACWLFCTPSPTLSSPAPTRFFSLVSLLVPSAACIPAQNHHTQPISLHHLCRGRCADMSICLSRTSALVAVPVPKSARLFGSHWSRWCVLHPPLPAVRRDCEAIACDGRGQFSLSIYTLSLRLCSTLSWRLSCTRVWCMHVKPTTPQTSGNDQYWEQKPPCLVAPARTPTLYPSIRCRLLHNDINPLCQRRASVLQCAALFWCLDIFMSLALVYCPPPPPPCDNRFPSPGFGGTSSQSPAATMPPNGYPLQSQRVANAAAARRPSPPSPKSASPVSQTIAQATYTNHGRRASIESPHWSRRHAQQQAPVPRPSVMVASLLSPCPLQWFRHHLGGLQYAGCTQVLAVSSKHPR